MTVAFWDTSALVPLCVEQKPSLAVRRLVQRYEMVVWWGTRVEMRSAFERLLRTKHLTAGEYASALARLTNMQRSWREMIPTEALRDQAEVLLGTYSLKAADALQLAAAWVWAGGVPRGFSFLCGDEELAKAAQRLGFEIVAT